MLFWLELDNNKIKEITRLDALINLEHLHLNNNLITEIKGLENLNDIIYLNLRNNSLSGLEDYLVNSGLEIRKIIAYCRNKTSDIDEIRYL